MCVCVVSCPHCGAAIAFNDRSTRRRCRNIDCKELVTKASVRTAIEQELEIKANNQALLDLFPPGGVYSDEDYERGIAMEEALDRFTGSLTTQALQVWADNTANPPRPRA